jgi:hypothetical protein
MPKPPGFSKNLTAKVSTEADDGITKLRHHFERLGHRGIKYRLIDAIVLLVVRDSAAREKIVPFMPALPGDQSERPTE